MKQKIKDYLGDDCRPTDEFQIDKLITLMDLADKCLFHLGDELTVKSNGAAGDALKVNPLLTAFLAIQTKIDAKINSLNLTPQNRAKLKILKEDEGVIQSNNLQEAMN